MNFLTRMIECNDPIVIGLAIALLAILIALIGFLSVVAINAHREHKRTQKLLKQANHKEYIG